MKKKLWSIVGRAKDLKVLQSIAGQASRVQGYENGGNALAGIAGRSNRDQDLPTPNKVGWFGLG
jgi:hypothetical protein